MLGERRSDDAKSENQKTIVIPIGVRAGVSNPFQAVGREGNVWSGPATTVFRPGMNARAQSEAEAREDVRC